MDRRLTSDPRSGLSRWSLRPPREPSCGVLREHSLHHQQMLRHLLAMQIARLALFVTRLEAFGSARMRMPEG